MLPADYTRCMGLTPLCPQRKQCARHCDIPDNASISWVKNLNIEGVEDCLHFIEYSNDH